MFYVPVSVSHYMSRQTVSTITRVTSKRNTQFICTWGCIVYFKSYKKFCFAQSSVYGTGTGSPGMGHSCSRASCPPGSPDPAPPRRGGCGCCSPWRWSMKWVGHLVIWYRSSVMMMVSLMTWSSDNLIIWYLFATPALKSWMLEVSCFPVSRRSLSWKNSLQLSFL